MICLHCCRHYCGLLATRKVRRTRSTPSLTAYIRFSFIQLLAQSHVLLRGLSSLCARCRRSLSALGRPDRAPRSHEAFRVRMFIAGGGALTHRLHRLLKLFSGFYTPGCVCMVVFGIGVTFHLLQADQSRIAHHCKSPVQAATQTAKGDMGRTRSHCSLIGTIKKSFSKISTPLVHFCTWRYRSSSDNRGSLDKERGAAEVLVLPLVYRL